LKKKIKPGRHIAEEGENRFLFDCETDFFFVRKILFCVSGIWTSFTRAMVVMLQFQCKDRAAQKVTVHVKSGQRSLKNNRHASFTKVWSKSLKHSVSIFDPTAECWQLNKG